MRSQALSRSRHIPVATLPLAKPQEMGPGRGKWGQARHLSAGRRRKTVFPPVDLVGSASSPASRLTTRTVVLTDEELQPV